MELNKIYLGDCLEKSKEIESGSVDLIVTDPPYGNMKGIEKGNTSWKNTNVIWDEVIKPSDLFEVANRILRRNGRLILFSQEPYTFELLKNAISNLPLCYKMVWEKGDYGNALFAKKAPLIMFEDILVFKKTHDTDGIHPLRAYFKDVMEYIGLNKKQLIERIGQRVDHVTRINSTQFSLCTESTYNELIEVFGINQMDNFKTFEELKEIDEETKNTAFPSVFNLWDGKKYKSNILKYRKDYTGLHPTQKPVLLIEDLIKTYSNEGDVVVDLTCGSGTTAVAAINTGRDYICIEKDEGYYEVAVNRTNEEPQLNLEV